MSDVANRMDAASARRLIVASLRDAILAAGLDPQALADDVDLRMEGIVDSFGFVQLIADLETRLGCQIDLESLAPEKLTVLGPFSAHIASVVSGCSGHLQVDPNGSMSETADRDLE